MRETKKAKPATQLKKKSEEIQCFGLHGGAGGRGGVTFCFNSMPSLQLDQQAFTRFTRIAIIVGAENAILWTRCQRLHRKLSSIRSIKAKVNGALACSPFAAMDL